MDLHKFHGALQVVMGWMKGHLYEFDVAGERVGIPDPKFGDDIRSDRKIKLADAPRAPGDRVLYAYDMGDGWEHDVVLEEVLAAEPGLKLPACLEWENACPPEDCGGVGGYEELREAIRDPKHPRHREMLEWLDRPFDPAKFDLQDVNEGLRAQFRR